MSPCVEFRFAFRNTLLSSLTLSHRRVRPDRQSHCRRSSLSQKISRCWNPCELCGYHVHLQHVGCFWRSIRCWESVKCLELQGAQHFRCPVLPMIGSGAGIGAGSSERPRGGSKNATLVWIWRQWPWRCIRPPHRHNPSHRP